MEQNVSQCSQGSQDSVLQHLEPCSSWSRTQEVMSAKSARTQGLRLYGGHQRERETTKHHLFLQTLKAPCRRDVAPPNPPLVAHPPPPENLRCVRRVHLSTRMMTVQPGANRQAVCLRCCNPTNNHNYCADDVLITW